MIVEHTFITTLDPDRAFALAEELLGPLRFQPEPAPHAHQNGHAHAPSGPGHGAVNGTANGAASPGVPYPTDAGSPQVSVAAPPTTAATIPAPASRSWKRGARRPGRANGQGDIPTRVRMDFDRGRVVVAASVDAPGMDTPRLPKLLAVGITLALERILAHGHTTADARADCERYSRGMVRRDQVRNAILLSLIGLVVATIAALIAFAPFR